MSTLQPNSVDRSIPTDELGHFLRALSHDLNANFMLLEHSLGKLIDSPETGPAGESNRDEQIAHVRACLGETKRFLADLATVASTGGVRVKPADVDTAEALGQVLFELRDLIASRGVEIEAPEPLPHVWLDHHELKQVLTNLIRNAIQHGCDARRPRITISSPPSMRETTGDPRLATLCVYDNGPGIARSAHEEVFLPGRRGPKPLGAGSGMGLAIVRKIVQRQGGSIHIDPGRRRGTTFVLTLPKPPQARLQRPAPPDASSGRRLEHDAPHEGRGAPPSHRFRGSKGRRVE